MKKLSILAVILALAIALTACSSEEASETVAANPGDTVAATAPVETAAPAQPLTLTTWNMTASTWSSPNGATVHITATPSYYQEGQTADFVVRMEGDDVSQMPCQWDGKHYSASIDLNAANGYCYYVVLTAADGTTAEVAVNTPAAPINEAFIDMEASLASFCSIVVEDHSVDGSQLVLTGGKVQVQVPRITNEGESITCQEAALVLSLEGKELDKNLLTLTQTDTPGLYEAALENIAFDIPELDIYQKIDLTLNATLSNGQTLSAYGGNWQSSTDGLLPVMG